MLSFREGSGTWSEPVNLGPQYKGLLPIVSPDGRYFFFSRDLRAYWADAGGIGELRSRGR